MSIYLVFLVGYLKKKKLMFELLETVKRSTETNMAAGNLKDPNGNTFIVIVV